ncbi:MAG: coenzyme F420-0:L-glutamate ligase [bacterium]
MAERPKSVEILPVDGIGEVRPGDDLGAIIAGSAGWLREGDVLVVTSKIVSKSEGRLVPVHGKDPWSRELTRQHAIDSETVRVVARRGDLRIVANRQGVVLAGAGVDASNVAGDEISLLPADPDASARRLCDAIAARLGVRVGVIISDSLGRAWRRGIIDVALGVAGLAAIQDMRGSRDKHGNELQATEIALADEIASAADLVKGKLSDIPVAVVRGLHLRDDGAGSGPLIRTSREDMFRLGTAEALVIGREDAGGALARPGPLHEDARAVIEALPAGFDPQADAVREAFLGFLHARPDAMWRSCLAGHLTASAVIVDPTRSAVLLTLHPRVGSWVQLGGHCERKDAALVDAAAREGREESGIGSLSLDPEPLNLDVHAVTCSLGVPTRHFDVRFLAIAPPAAEPVISSESVDLRWFPWDELPPDSPPDLARSIALARQRIGP